MRIGVFSDSYRPYTSGVVTSIVTFKDELTKMGHETFIFAPNYPNYHDEEENIFRFLSVPSPGNPDFTVAVPLSPRVTSVAKKLNLDIIHVHSPFVLGQMGARCSRKIGVPLVFTYHTLYGQYVHYVPMAQDFARELAIKYSSYFSNRCDLVITPSADVRTLITSYGIRTPIEVIPTGVEINKFSKGDSSWLRQRYDIPENKKICLFVGRLTIEKNLGFLLQAFKRVKEQYPEVCLVIIATGPIEKELKKSVINLGMTLNQDVIFTGFLPFENLVDAYSGADIFTFASVTETQGIVLVEAMAGGLPVVAIKATGSQEMIEDGRQGFLSDNDLESFYSRILWLLKDDQLRKRMSDQAMIRATELSSRAMARRLERQYNLLLEERRTKGERGFTDSKSG